MLACLVGFETGKVVDYFAYLFIGVRMADVVARKLEGTALARRQNIFEDPGFVWRAIEVGWELLELEIE